MKFTNPVDKRVKNDVIQLASASGIAQYKNPSNDEALQRVHANLVRDINYYEKKKPKGGSINISDRD